MSALKANQAFRDLQQQTTALHARYTSLRAERQKVHSGILESLKAGEMTPTYVHGILEQQLALAAMTASMDVCVARLKTLEDRKAKAFEALTRYSIYCQEQAKQLQRATAAVTVTATESVDLQSPVRLGSACYDSKRDTAQTIQVYMDTQDFFPGGDEEILKYYESVL